jgi:prepilin-type N-terminal cleavage/methylation domain-containing protein
MSRRPTPLSNHGFSLIEVIVTLTVAAILGTILIQFMGSNLSNSAAGVNAFANELKLRQTMEKITADYRHWLETHPEQTLASFRAIANAHQTGQITVTNSSDGFEINPGSDGDIEILEITVSVNAVNMGDLSLRSFFTK